MKIKSTWKCPSMFAVPQHAFFRSWTLGLLFVLQLPCLSHADQALRERQRIYENVVELKNTNDAESEFRHLDIRGSSLKVFLATTSNVRAESARTLSKEILASVIDDIRQCSKAIRYEFDSEKNSINPPQLEQIHGFKLKNLQRDISVIEIDETYLGLRANLLLVGRPNTGAPWSVIYVAFNENYGKVRSRLEDRWRMRFKSGLRPGPEVIRDGDYAEKVLRTQVGEMTLSIERMPIDVYPYIKFPYVGCNHGDSQRS